MYQIFVVNMLSRTNKWADDVMYIATATATATAHATDRAPLGDPACHPSQLFYAKHVLTSTSAFRLELKIG